jgi:hypothetical protein
MESTGFKNISWPTVYDYRTSPRFSFMSPILYYRAGQEDKPCSAKILNYSVWGVFVETDYREPKDTSIFIRFLTELEQFDIDTRTWYPATVKWNRKIRDPYSSEFAFGAQFTLPLQLC